MKPKSSFITVTDQFCGAGGSSQGVRNYGRSMGGGIEVSMALNHWKLAIETHNTNFPNTFHDCTDISACDPRKYMSTDILITSPECTNHSLAKGKKRIQSQLELYQSGIIDPSAERSRATMWDVCRFAEYHNYNIIIVENVVDARSWIMWEAWLNAMHLLGYNHKCVYLNSMHAHPTPQSRDRMYVVFWKKGNKAPNLEYTPKAWCSCCEKQVNSVQSWRNPRRQFGKYKQQYDYRCPSCGVLVDPYYFAAFNVIDWTIPGKKIGDRKKDLALNTIERIKYGIDKYKNSEFVIYLDHSKGMPLTSHIDDPMRTQTTRQISAIITTRYTSGIDCRVKGMNDTIGTQPGDVSHAVMSMPSIMTKGGYNGGSNSLESVEPTITTQHNFGVAGVPFIVENFKQSKTKEMNKPIGSMTTNVKHGILSNQSVNAFLSYYYGNNQASGITDPTGSMTTKDRVSLVMRPTDKIEIDDCTYRMLMPHEVKAAMAFDREYVVCGTGKDQVRQLGNAVTPPAMEWLIKRSVESLNC